MSQYFGYCSDHGYHEPKCTVCRAAHEYALTQFDRPTLMAREAVLYVSGLGVRQSADLVASVANKIREAEAAVNQQWKDKLTTWVRQQ